MTATEVYRAVDSAGRVECATPHGLVALLLTEVIDHIAVLEANIGKTRIAGEAQERADRALRALEGALDHHLGGETAALLGQVYGEARRCIMNAASSRDPVWCVRARDTVSPVVDAWALIDPGGHQTTDSRR